MGHTLSGVRVLRMDRPSAGGFLGLTALQAEGCGGGFAAVFYAAGGGYLLCAYFSADLNNSTHSGE